MALNLKLSWFALSLFFISACHKPILPSNAVEFATCSANFKNHATELVAARLTGAFHIFEPGSRTVSLKTRVLVTEDKLYLEFDALGFPATVVALSGQRLTIYQPFKQRAYIQKNSTDTTDLLNVNISWAHLIQLLLQKWQGVTLSAYSKNCEPLRGYLRSGEVVEWGKNSIKVTHEGRSIKWSVTSTEKNPELKPEWFDLSIPPHTRLLDNPRGLR